MRENIMLKKSKSIAFLSLCMMTFMFAQPALAAKNDDWKKDTVKKAVKVAEQVADVAGDALDVYEIYNDAQERGYVSSVAKYGTKAYVNGVIAGSATSAAVATAGTLGVTASTGTAIASLSGAAATSATMAAIGGPVATGIAAVTGVTLAPAVVGGAIVAGAATAVCYGVNCFIDWIW